jgi:stage III sporulation protein AA
MGVTADYDFFLGPEGQPVRPGVAGSGPDPVVTDDDEWERAVQLVTESSIYALEEELRNGYVTLPGGHRVGLVGRTVLEGGRIRTQRDLSGMNFRIARQVIGAADPLMPYLVDRTTRRPRSLLVVSSPALGKTTLLRDIARQLSSGVPAMGGRGWKVGVVDERSEIAACCDGVPQNDVGPRSDVLDACPKAEGMAIMVRSMSPEVIVTDEIGIADDARAIEEARRSGVAVIASAHARDLEDAAARPVLRDIMASGVFDIVAVLGRSLGLGTIESVLCGLTGARLSPGPFRFGGDASGGGEVSWRFRSSSLG